MHKIDDLKIWQKALDLTTEVYKATADFPSEEKFGITSQIRRSAVSVPSNIAEGAGRNSSKEFSRFMSIANGSALELQTQLIISNRLNLISNDTLKSLLSSLDEIQKMNYSFQRAISNN